MKIAACAKIVPATDTRIVIAGGGEGIDESGVKWIVSPYDSMAIERVNCNIAPFEAQYAATLASPIKPAIDE